MPRYYARTPSTTTSASWIPGTPFCMLADLGTHTPGYKWERIVIDAKKQLSAYCRNKILGYKIVHPCQYQRTRGVSIVLCRG